MKNKTLFEKQTAKVTLFSKENLSGIFLHKEFGQ